MFAGQNCADTEIDEIFAFPGFYRRVVDGDFLLLMRTVLLGVIWSCEVTMGGFGVRRLFFGVVWSPLGGF